MAKFDFYFQFKIYSRYSNEIMNFNKKLKIRLVI